MFWFFVEKDYLVFLTFNASLSALTRWLPTTSILVVTERIYRYQFKCNYLFAFLESTLNFQWLKKKEPHRSSISEVIDSERCAYLNA